MLAVTPGLPDLLTFTPACPDKGLFSAWTASANGPPDCSVHRVKIPACGEMFVFQRLIWMRVMTAGILGVIDSPDGLYCDEKYKKWFVPCIK